MNNLLDFEQYRQHLRLIEQQIIKQEMKHINESREPGGLITKWKKFRSSLFVDRILKEEIELGKEFEERIKSTMEELSKTCKELEGKTKKGSEFTKKINDTISDINKISFDTLSLLGDQKIDFGGFRMSVIMSNVVQFGVLFSPIRNMLMIRKAYHYFLGLIKQTIRKDLISLMINFDQFQNIILQKTHESITNAQSNSEMDRLMYEMDGVYKDAIRQNFKGEVRKVESTLKMIEQKRKQIEFDRKSDTVNGLFNNFDNTYKATAENIKTLVNDDSQKQLDALKNGISKLGQGDEDLTVYGEMLISAAEEKALKSSNTIHTNFLKMSEVFKLSNQKTLIELIEAAEKEETKKIKKEMSRQKEEFDIEVKEEEIKFFKDEFKKITDEYDLSTITLKQLDELKEKNVRFTYKNDDMNRETPDKNYSKYFIIVTCLQNYDDIYELDKCSYDLQMLIPREDNHYNIYNYIDVMGEDLYKTLVDNEDDKYFIDIKNINNNDKIENILKMFDCSTDRKEKRVKTALKYISENIVKFDYKELLYKFNEIGESTDDYDFDGIGKKLTKFTEEMNSYKSSSEYKEYQKKKKDYDDWKNYDYQEKSLISKIERLKDRKRSSDVIKKAEKELEALKKRHEELKKRPPTEPKKPDGEPKLDIELTVDINKKSYNDLKDAFKKMKEYSDNDYKNKEDEN